MKIDDLKALIAKALAITALSVAMAAAFNCFRADSLAWDWRPPPPAAAVMEDFGEMQAVMSRPGTVVVDARPGLFHKMGRIPGAISLPLDETSDADLAAWQKTLPADPVIVVYCSDSLCPMADKLARRMLSLGLSPSVFKPGFDGWETAGLPVESDIKK